VKLDTFLALDSQDGSIEEPGWPVRRGTEIPIAPGCFVVQVAPLGEQLDLGILELRSYGRQLEALEAHLLWHLSVRPATTSRPEEQGQHCERP